MNPKFAARLILSATLAAMMVSSAVGQTALFSHSFRATPQGNLNLNVICSPVVTTISGIVPVANTLSGSLYQASSTSGGIPDKRALSPPCFITNIHGQVVSSYVEVDNVYFPSNATIGQYHSEHADCATYSLGRVFCDATGNIDTVGVSNPCNFCSKSLHVEIDRDWQAAGFCGPGTMCDNVTLAPLALAGTALNMQGFVFWDGTDMIGHWELHALTAWKVA